MGFAYAQEKTSWWWVGNDPKFCLGKMFFFSALCGYTLRLILICALIPCESRQPEDVGFHCAKKKTVWILHFCTTTWEDPCDCNKFWHDSCLAQCSKYVFLMAWHQSEMVSIKYWWALIFPICLPSWFIIHDLSWYILYIHLRAYTHLMKIYNVILLEVVLNNGAVFVEVFFSGSQLCPPGTVSWFVDRKKCWLLYFLYVILRLLELQDPNKDLFESVCLSTAPVAKNCSKWKVFCEYRRKKRKKKQKVYCATLHVEHNLHLDNSRDESSPK